VSNLPNWVLDLVADLLEEEDVHPKYLAEMYDMATGKHIIKPYPWCPAKPLQRVPDDVKLLARTVRAYQMQAECDRENEIERLAKRGEEAL